MFATMPELAREWAHETDFSKLPQRVRKKKPKKSKKKKDKNDSDLNPQPETPGQKALMMADEFLRHLEESESLEPN